METPKAQLFDSQFVELDSDTRRKIVQIFGLEQSGGSSIYGGKLITSGYTNKDLSKITVETMQTYLNNYETIDFYALFEKVLNKLKENKPKEEVKSPPDDTYNNWARELLRLKNEAENQNLILKLNHLVWDLFPKPIHHVGSEKERPIKC